MRDALPEVRSEDPLIVAINAVVGDDGSAFAATGDADELHGSVFRCVFAARRFFFGVGIENIRDERKPPGYL